MGYSWWRLAFIFLPAAVRGDLGSLGLYVPFVFGYFVRNVTKELCKKKKRALWRWSTSFPFIPTGYIPSLLQLVLFLTGVWWKKLDLRSIPNFFISSFVSPMLRFWFQKAVPDYLEKYTWAKTWGDIAVYVMLVFGLLSTWLYQGIDTLFLGFLFLQAVPEVQRHFWFRPTAHIVFVSVIMAFSLPYVSIGLMNWYFPSYLEYLPTSYLQWLIYFANAAPNLTDYYLVLGLERGASEADIRKAYRKLARQYHPDKVGDDPVKIKQFHKIAEANNKLTNKEARIQYDELMSNPELNELNPRCIAFVVMMGYWLLHALIDWNDVEQVKETHKRYIRNHILGGGPVNLKGLGLTEREPLETYARNEDNDLPFLQYNNRVELIELRTMLEDVGLNLGPLPVEDDGGDCVLPKGEPERAQPVAVAETPDGEEGAEGAVTRVSDAREKAVRKLGHGPSNKAEAKQFKSKMNRYKSHMKKQKSSFGGCAVQ